MVITRTGEVRGRIRWVVCAAAALMAGSAWSQAWRVEPSVAATAVLSNNVDMVGRDAARSDLVLTLSPLLLLRGTGAGYQLEGSIGATAVHYTGNTLTDRLLPNVHVGLKSRIVDRLFFVESRIDAETTGVDPFRTVGDGATTYNKQNVTRLRLSPYIDRELSPQTRLLLRSDNTWANVGTAETETATATTTPSSDAYVQSNLLRFEAQPRPLGLQLEGTRLDTRLKQQGVESTVLNDTVRGVVTYAPDPQLFLGLRYGHDRVEYSTTRVSDTFKGYGLRWAPTERTNLDAALERRFFGNGWMFNLAHRTPFLNVSANYVRQLTSYAQSLASLPTSGSTTAMLDEIYRLSIPDAAKRSELIRNIIAKYNLPANMTGPFNIFSDRPQVQTAGGLTLALLGVRHALTLRVFQQKTIDLPGSDLTVQLPASNVLQRGWTIDLNRRLTPDTAANVGLNYARNENLGGLGLGGETTIRGVRLGLTQRLSPRSDATAGLRHNRATSTVGVAEAIESAAFVGMTHRF